MTTEAYVSQQSLLFAQERYGATLWRNNSGAYFDDNGRLVRYGLCNETKEMNKQFKSSDKIGFTSLVITPEMVGCTVAVFTALEDKKPNWKLRPSDERAQAQLRYIQLVRNAGGYAGFISDPARDVERVYRGEITW